MECDGCGHPAAEHGWCHGCGHTITVRERDQIKSYVCACLLQPGEVIGTDSSFVHLR